MPNSQLFKAPYKVKGCEDQSPHVCQHVDQGACLECRGHQVKANWLAVKSERGDTRIPIFEAHAHRNGGQQFRKAMRCLRLLKLRIGNQYRGHWYGPARPTFMEES